MLILTKDEIKKLFSMKEAIQASKEALGFYSAGKTIAPLRTKIELMKHQGQSLFMPAYIEPLDVSGIKIVTICPNNIVQNLPAITAQMLLIEAKTGKLCAMIDGTYLTQLRTGGLQGAATDTLARQDAKIAVLFGAGAQASAQLEAMLTVRQLSEVRVFDINFESAQKFVFSMQQELKHFNTKIIAVPSGNEAIKDADIITTVTTSKSPIFDGASVKKGAHINGLGAFTPQMQELPESIIKKADKIIFDTREGVFAEAGDIIIPKQSGMVFGTNLNLELGEVILGWAKGRETDSEITIFKAVGTAVLDVVTAYYIYQQALASNIKHQTTL